MALATQIESFTGNRWEGPSKRPLDPSYLTTELTNPTTRLSRFRECIRDSELQPGWENGSVYSWHEYPGGSDESGNHKLIFTFTNPDLSEVTYTPPKMNSLLTGVNDHVRIPGKFNMDPEFTNDHLQGTGVYATRVEASFGTLPVEWQDYLTVSRRYQPGVGLIAISLIPGARYTSTLDSWIYERSQRNYEGNSERQAKNKNILEAYQLLRKRVVKHHTVARSPLFSLSGNPSPE